MSVHRDISVKALWKDATVPAAGTTLTSDVIDLGGLAQDGYFSAQYYVRNAAGASVYAVYELSNDGVNFVQSTEGYKIASNTTDGWHDNAGHAADGRDLVRFSPTMAARMRLKVWEVNSAGASLDLYCAIQ